MGFVLSGSDISYKSALILVTVPIHSFGCSILNQFSEVAFDSKMDRTKHRPLVTGYFDMKWALLVGSLFIIISIYVPILFGKYKVALLYLFNFVIYNIIYTKLKILTSFALLIGSIAGSLPPIIGWLIGGHSINREVLIVSGVFYLWQVPHFLFLTEIYKDDYAKAGFKVLINNINGNIYNLMKSIWIFSYFIGLIYVLILFNAFNRVTTLFVFVEMFIFILLIISKIKGRTAFGLTNISIIIFTLGLILNKKIL